LVLVGGTLVALLHEYPGTPMSKLHGISGSLPPPSRAAAYCVLADDHLERGGGREVVLGEGREHAVAAAVGDLLVERRAGRQVRQDGPLLAAVRAAPAADAGAVALLRRLRAPRVPDHLLAGPAPAQPPPRALDVPVQLVVLDAHHDLRTEQIDRPLSLRQFEFPGCKGK